ncbi:hypothetical protein R0135_17205 [Congregibacter variabilis]|uniref:Uncharacterized protein n=1 Tax=Congregibacter variabilis TaxID=3081200 RepID=A0ABZ0I4P5_9GAMM|nr:hypothetical protein R0135_17205 [Congregibacter sp. IMCC43200]
MHKAGEVEVGAQQVRRTDRRSYQILLAMAVSCFFVVSVFTRLLPRALRPFAASARKRESCFEEARRVALAVIPYAFEW